jgi:hypothetical protein
VTTPKTTRQNEGDLFDIPPLDTENPWFRKTSKDDPIWKTRKYYICQTPGMTLWVALTQMQCFNCLERECDDHRKHYREAVLSFPDEVSACRCKNCRYLRLTKNKT